MRSWLHCFGSVLLVTTILLVSACDPGSSDGIDPGVIEIPIAFVNRPIPVDNMGQPIQADLRRPLLFSQGGDVLLRTNSTVNAAVVNITSSVTGTMGDVKGLNASFDGKKIIFSLRLFDPDVNNPPTPSWNIYEYDLVNSQLKRIISTDLVAEEGDDLFPAYLPDGRILFTSNRQRQSREVLINEIRPAFSALDEDERETALVLHVMNADGSAIHQISFNQSHDLQPQVLTGQYAGQIVFSRWDNAAGNNSVQIYKSNPDGSDLEMIYGRHSHATGTGGSNIQFTGVREMANGNLMVIAKPFSGTFDGGDILIIDVDRFVDIDKPVWSLSGLAGPAQVPATVNNVTTDGSISANGRYMSAFPLRDGSGRILVSKSTCQIRVNAQIRPCIDPWISTPGAVEVSPAYAIWLYDMGDNTQKVVVLAEPGRVITDAIAIQPQPLPPIIFDKGPGILDNAWESANLGVINIKSVYDFGDTSFDGCFFNVCTTAPGMNSAMDFADPVNATAAQRPARFVRFVKAVAIPDPDDPTLVNPPDLANTAFGPQRNRGMREIVGYAPVEPDGSVKVRVPANIPLALEVLDSEGRRIGPPHLNWFQVRPGDSLNCVGCHSHNTAGSTPEVHARADAGAPSINTGLPVGLQFVNTLIPGTVSPNLYWGNFGETMAEVRFDRVGLAIPPAPEPQLDTDLVYVDYWSDPAASTPNTPYSYRYANLDLSIASPLNPFCSPPAAFNCRIIINYPQQIHAIWQLDRGDDMVTPTDLPAAPDMTPNDVGDDTCTQCHTTTRGGADRVAAGQLELTDGISDQNADHLTAYRELLFNDQGEQLIGGTLMNIQIQVPLLDGNGDPVLDAMDNPVFVSIDDPAAVVTPSMTANGARRSYFLEKMTAGELDNLGRTLSGVVDHSAMLSDDELKLISEWLDLGAQYFNDPFDPAAPQN